MEIQLHKGQSEVFNSPARFKVVVSGRRYGKTRLGITQLLTASLGFQGTVDPVSPQRVMAALPTLQQAKPLIWEPLVSLCEGELAPIVRKIDRQNHVIHWAIDKPSIVVTGANDKNGDGLRGNRIWFFLGDEIQDFKPSLFDTIIIPAMADTPGSSALLTGTPKGKLNGLYELFERGLDPKQPEWVCFNHPTEMNPFVPRELIESARLTMPPRLFEQEFRASFVDFPGKIYYELGEENLTDYYPESFEKTILGYDFGDVNPAMSVLGLSKGIWYCLEGWQPNHSLPRDQRTPIPQEIQDREALRLCQKWDISATYCDPSRPATILGLRKLDHKGLRRAIAGYNRIEEGITQVHSLIYQRKLLFPKGTPGYARAPSRDYVSPQGVYDCLQSYHRATDKLGRVLEAVEDGQEDHVNDAIRYQLTRQTG